MLSEPRPSGSAAGRVATAPDGRGSALSGTFQLGEHTPSFLQRKNLFQWHLPLPQSHADQCDLAFRIHAYNPSRLIKPLHADPIIGLETSAGLAQGGCFFRRACHRLYFLTVLFALLFRFVLGYERFFAGFLGLLTQLL